MSLFPFYRYRFFNDPFFLHDLDFFDPWFDFDLSPTFVPMTPRYQRLKQSERVTYSSTKTSNNSRSLEQLPQLPQPEKFRVEVDVDGFNPDTIKKRIEGRKLIVEGKQEDRREERNYTSREMRKTFDLPEHADSNGLTSYVTSGNNMVIEVPIQTPQANRQLTQARNDHRSLTQFGQDRYLFDNDVAGIDDSNLQLRVINTGNNQKQLEVNVDVKNYQPQELKVSVKNNELIVQGEYQRNDANRSERSSFFKSATLPRGTQIQQLQAHLDEGGQLKIEGPVL